MSAIMAIIGPLLTFLNNIFKLFKKSGSAAGQKIKNAVLKGRKELEKDPNKRPPR